MTGLIGIAHVVGATRFLNLSGQWVSARKPQPAKKSQKQSVNIYVYNININNIEYHVEYVNVRVFCYT